MIYSKKTISAICDVQSGYTARSGLKTAPEGGVPTVQLRDLRGEDDFDPASAPLYPLGESLEHYWARAGDLLFRSRGERNTAVLIAPDFDQGGGCHPAADCAAPQKKCGRFPVSRLVH